MVSTKPMDSFDAAIYATKELRKIRLKLLLENNPTKLSELRSQERCWEKKKNLFTMCAERMSSGRAQEATVNWRG